MPDRTFSSTDVIRIWQNHLTVDEKAEVIDFFIDEGVLRIPESPDDPFIDTALQVLDEIFARVSFTMAPNVTDEELERDIPRGTVRRAAFDTFVRLGGVAAAPTGRRFQFFSRAGAIRGREVRRQRAQEETD